MKIFEIRFPIALVLGFLALACQSMTDITKFKTIALKMEKGDVVDIMGGPNRKERKDNRDWWYYNLYNEGERADRLVVFESGRVIYSGKADIQKGLTAEEMDKLNESQNSQATQEQNKREVDRVEDPN